MKLPNKKITNYVEQQADGELLIYNLLTNQTYCLNQTAAAVFNACDGRATFDELKRKYNFSNELIFLALDELRRAALIEGDYISPFADIDRREAVKRVGLASLIALPIITSLIAPTAIAAASTCVNPGGMAAGTQMYNCGTVRYGLCQAGCEGNPTGLRNCCSNTAKIDPSTCPPGTDVNRTGCSCVCA